MEAVVYTSNTGSTEHYAKLLGYELSVSVYSTEEAGNKLPAGTEIIYLGWIMAGKIQGYGLARKKYKICAVCAVGMGQTGNRSKPLLPNFLACFCASCSIVFNFLRKS